MKRFWPYFLLFGLVLLAYGNSLNNVFLSDDLAEIAQNPNIGNFSGIFNHTFGYIRPFLYWVIFHITGLNPAIYRLLNVFLHTGVVFLIYIIVNRLHSKTIALIVASIFAVHPAISEAVVWISGGSYPQYTFFFLLSLLFYILSDKKKLYLFLSALFYLLSFMSHPQMPLALFIIYPLYEFCFGDLKKNWKKSIPFLIVTAIYSLIVITSIPARAIGLQSLHYQQLGIDNIFLLIPIAISSYLELTFFPIILTLYHSEIQYNTIEFIIRAIITLLLIIATLVSFKKNKAIFFYLALFWISLAPTLTPFRLNWIVAERYFYLPIIGILISLFLAIDILEKKYKIKWAYFSIIPIVVLLLISRTFIRNIDWKNEDNLWIATGKTSPSSPNTHNNLGDVYGRAGDKEKARQEFQKAVDMKPNYADAYHNLANTYVELGDRQKALENYQKAIEYNPRLWQSYQNIGALYYQDKQYDKALEYIQKAITINTQSVGLYLSLGTIYLGKGEKDKAKEVFTMIINADPSNQFAKQGLAEADK